MAERILTLCDACKAEMEIGGFRVKQVPGRTTTEQKKKCENCAQTKGGSLRQYIVSGKGR